MKQILKSTLGLLVAIVVMCGLTPPTSAQLSYVWIPTKTGNQNWNTTSANWTSSGGGSTWTNGGLNTATLSATSAVTLSVSSNITLNQLIFTDSNFTLTGNNKLIFGTTAGGSSSIISVASGQTANIGVAIDAGIQGLTVQGGGTLNVTDNIDMGPTSGTTPNTLRVNGATTTLTMSQAITTSANNLNIYIRGTGNFVLQGNGTINPNGSGDVEIGGEGGTFTIGGRGIRGNSTTSVVVGGNVNDVIIFDAPNTFAGGLTVNAGTLRVGDAGGSSTDRIPTGNQITINANGILSFEQVNGNASGPNNYVLNAGSILQNYTTTAGVTIANSITMNGALIRTLGVTAGRGGEDFELQGNLTVGGSSLSTINLSHGLGLNGIRTFNVGDSVAGSGIDLLLLDGASGTGAMGILQDAVTLNGSGNANGTVAGGLIKTGLGAMSINGPSTYTATQNVTVNGTSIAFGTQINAGTLLANNATGSATGLNRLLVASTGTLGGGNAAGTEGFIGGAVTVAGGGTLAPGNPGSTGILTLNNGLTFAGTSATKSNYAVDIHNKIAGSGYDQTKITSGSVALGTNVTKLLLNTSSLSGTFSWGDQLVILDNTGAGSLSGNFISADGLTPWTTGSTVGTFGGYNWQIFYNIEASLGGPVANNDVVIRAVPEPATIQALVAATVMAGYAGRRRWRQLTGKSSPEQQPAE